MENQSRKNNDDICLPLWLIFLKCSSTSFPLPMSYNCILELIILPENCQNTCTSPHDIITSLSDPRGCMVSAETFGTLLGSLNENTFGLILTKNTSCWNIFVYNSVYFQLYTSFWLISSQLKCDDMVGTSVCLTITVNFRTKINLIQKKNHSDVPKRCVPERMFWIPLVPTLIVPCDPLSLDWYIPVIKCMIHHIYVIKMTGMYRSKDIGSQGTINVGTRGSRTFVRGHIVQGYPVTPPF